MLVTASVCAAAISLGGGQADAGDQSFTRAKLGLLQMIDAPVVLENLGFEPVTDSGIALEGTPNPILAVGARAFPMELGIPAADLRVDLAPPFRTVNAGDATYFSNQQVFTMVIAQLLGAPVLSDAAVSEVSLAWTLFGQPVLETSEVANEPLIGHANAASSASIAGEELNGFAVIVDGVFEQFANPIPTFEFFRDDGYYLAWMIPGIPENIAVTSSHASELSFESMYAMQAPVPIPSEIIDLDDPELLAIAAQSMRDFQLSLLTPEEYVQAVLGGPVTVDPPADPPAVEQVTDPPAAEQVTDPPVEDVTADPQIDDPAEQIVEDPPTEQSPAAVDQPVDDAADEAAVDGADPPGVDVDVALPADNGESSNSGGNGWLKWLLLLGVPVALAVAIVMFLRGRRDRLFADPREWTPVFEDDNPDEDFLGRFRHRTTGETVGSDDPRYAGLQRELLPAPPTTPLPPDPIPPDPIEANEAMMASVEDAVSLLVEPDDSVPPITTGSSPTASAGPPDLEGPGDDLTDRLRWFAFLDDPPVSSGGWSPVSNAALTTAYTGDVPESVDPDAFSGVLIDLVSGDELHPGDPGYDAAIDELGLEPIDRVDPTVELDERRERERQEYLDRGEPPPPELTKPIGTTDDAGLA